MTKTHPSQYEVWISDLTTSVGSEPGKIRPVVILQSDLLNRAGHGSFIVCAISSQPREGVSLIRIAVDPNDNNGLLKRSYILCDQMRAIDKNRLMGRIGKLDRTTIDRLSESIKVILTL